MMKLVLSIFIFSLTTVVLAGDPETIRACGDLAFTKNRDLNVCMKSGAEAETVKACAKMSATDMKLVNECITSGANNEKITSCVRSTSDSASLSDCLKS